METWGPHSTIAWRREQEHARSKKFYLPRQMPCERNVRAITFTWNKFEIQSVL